MDPRKILKGSWEMSSETGLYRRDIMPALSGSDILAIIEEICEFGPRWMGSSGADRAVDFIADQFQASGLTVEPQPFRYLAYKPGFLHQCGCINPFL